jgi:hypothetical protein
MDGCINEHSLILRRPPISRLSPWVFKPLHIAWTIQHEPLVDQKLRQEISLPHGPRWWVRKLEKGVWPGHVSGIWVVRKAWKQSQGLRKTQACGKSSYPHCPSWASWSVENFRHRACGHPQKELQVPSKMVFGISLTNTQECRSPWELQNPWWCMPIIPAA